MPSQTAGSARAPVFGHAPTASESGHRGEKRTAEMGKGEGREGEREREGKRRLQHHLQCTRQGKAVHNGGRTDPNKQGKESN